jgi:hypothetical protein
MQLDHTHLKVDQTLLHYGGSFLLVSNINIPQGDFYRLDTVLDRVQHFIAQDYVGVQNIHYQVCATYLLRNRATGETRLWTGSFNPRGNRLNILQEFQLYQATGFKTAVTRACSAENIYNKLRFFHVATDWVFERCTSAIVSVQANVDPLHPTVENRGLLLVRNGRYTRVHNTFYLA